MTGLRLPSDWGIGNPLIFDFFSRSPFDPAVLGRDIAYLAGAEPVRIDSYTLTCSVERGGPVSFFGNLGLGEAAPREIAEGSRVHVASLLDIAGTKALSVQQRAQARDYLYTDTLIRCGIGVPQLLAAGSAIYGRSSFNPLIALKTLSYFGDVPSLPAEVQNRLGAAVEAVDPASLAVPRPHPRRESGRAK